jgi:DNA mismatch repair protein MutS
MGESTPLMRQYEALKAAHPGALLLFRVGDFYELFGNDAIEAAPLLDIALTTRDRQKEDAVPLCGVPHHAVSGYIAKLLAAGKTVALAEQMEEPRPGILVRRDVVRVLTPGTVLDDDLLPGREHAYLAAVLSEGDEAALACVDLSTGDFHVTSARGESATALVAEDLARREPREVLNAPSWRARQLAGVVYQASPLDAFDGEAGVRALREQFQTDESWTCLSLLERRAAGALLRYVHHTLKGRAAPIRVPSRYALSEFVGLDPSAQRTLELTRGADGNRRGSLLWAMDETVTPMGGRLLRERLVQPLRARTAVEARQAEVTAFLADPATRGAIRDALADIQDVERAVARIAMSACTPRDLALLARSLEAGARVGKALAAGSDTLVTELGRGWEEFGDLVDLLARALVPTPPPTVRDGGVIRDEYHAELDELRALRRDGKGWIAQLEARERARTGIESLKIRHNQVFGYYLEVTKANAARVPAEYHRRQTLVNAERYVTQELMELEARVVGAEDKIRALEAQLFEDLRRAAAAETTRLQAHARRLAALDVASALAEAANRHGWSRPTLVDETVLCISEGRHPVVERLLPAQRFIPNSTEMDGSDRRLLLLTGPNMAGKSTYMRQVALIVVMAQMGSYVPAEDATIGLVDQIFTRVGAHDDIAGGRSTFMVEMSETASILARATSRSLILLDEIGRGTSTFDGISIAWAVAEDVHHRIGARTLFATHYHELTELAATLPGLKNYKAAVREWNDEIIFLRKIIEGGADRSYGIQVARLAGLPEGVVRRAREILSDLEQRDAQHPTVVSASTETQPDLFTPPPHPVIEELIHLDVLTMTPIDALNALDRLQRKARGA